ncbi:acyl-CoA thioesterase [Shimia ponticola]|uniref:acyl-CoA thioesterase n=1 Tax=Shimia ponticola TaxID=2582893 RepID=UPI0011BDFF2F|nr:thioesterase family protein [Shimia ponticola]
MTPFLTPLTPEQLREEGIPSPWNFGMKDRVRFGELDVLNHVNNAAYLRWFENFRIQYFRDYGISDYGDERPRIVLRNIGLEFLGEVLLNDEYVVTGRTISMRRTSWAMEYGVWVNGRQTTGGNAVLVLLNQDGKKIALPEAWRKSFVLRDGAEQL